MIIVSLLLIVVAVVLLALGLVDGANGYLVGSIAASLLAAVSLITGGRRTGPAKGNRTGNLAAARSSAGAADLSGEPAAVPQRPEPGQADSAGPADTTVEPDLDRPGSALARVGSERVGSESGGSEPGESESVDSERGDSELVESGTAARSAVPAQRAEPMIEERPPVLPDQEIGGELTDEPPAQRSSAAATARVVRAASVVVVVDGRPRYHLPSCHHLIGREAEPLPVDEAIELGFTPCGLCEPDTRILAQGSRLA